MMRKAFQVPTSTRSFERLFFGWTSQQKNVSSQIIKKLGVVSPQREVPGRISRPQYILTGEYPAHEPIRTKLPDEIRQLKKVCSLARTVLNETAKEIKPGVTTDYIDEVVHYLAIEQKSYPSPLLYKGFPKSVCTSVNNVAMHGIPDDRELLDGDIINLDVTLYRGGFHGDLSETFAVGTIDQKARDLIAVTKQALDNACSVCKPGINLTEIGKSIRRTLAGTGFSVIPYICGHGIGRDFHESPDIFHVEFDCDIIMKPGMVFTIEPCVSEGGTEVSLLHDKWTVVTKDDSRTAQFEHTVLITLFGHEVLTRDVT